jgi:putative transferase (TIGR04331 family)
LNGNSIAFRTSIPAVKPTKPGLKRQVLRLAGLLTRAFSSRAKYFIHTPYLPLLSSTKVHLALRQFPQMWDSESNKPLPPLDLELRRAMRERFSNNYLNLGDVSAQEKMMVENLSLTMPINFLEGFVALGGDVATRGWPRGPKVIFTSNRFDTDDAFKLYVVRQRQNGSRYFVGQHGNNYGSKRTMFPSIEETTSDKFFTWGWSHDASKHVALFNLKMAGMHEFTKKKSGQLLLLQTHRAHAFELENPFVSHNIYFSWQERFYNVLGSQAKAFLRVRFHSGHVFFGWGETERWIKMLRGGTTISSSSVPIFREFSKSRIVVHTYDSTGMLETLAGNVPTVAFWPMGLSHLTKEAEEDYQKLISAKIVHMSPESAAHHINLVLQDVDEWWSSSVVQKVRMDFVDKYSRLSSRPIRELTHAIRGGESLAR